MSYTVNQKVIYITIEEKKVDAKIVARKIDFENGNIKTEFASGNFDYLVSIENNGKIEEHFCNESHIE
jgi:hypothetical protein